MASIFDSILSRLVSVVEKQQPPTDGLDVAGALSRSLAAGLPVGVGVGARPPTTQDPGPLGYLTSGPSAAPPAWAHGMQVAETAGPFIDQLGVASRVSTIVPQPTYEVIRGVGGPAIGYIIAAAFTVDSRRFERTITFTDGCVWFVASELEPAIPDDGFVGIAFATATLRVPTTEPPGPPGPPVSLPGRPQPPLSPIVIPAAATGGLSLWPGTTDRPAGAIDDDGALATIVPPAKADFALSPEGIFLIELGDASVTVYGSTFTLAGGRAATSFDPVGLEWVVGYGSVSGSPLTCDGARSGVFHAAGSAPVAGGSWRLPVARTTADRLARATGSTLESRYRLGFAGPVGTTACSCVFADGRTGGP